MNNIKLITIFLIFIFLSCRNEKKDSSVFDQKKEKAIKYSFDLINKKKIDREREIKDSIINIEQNIAIGNINFRITKKEFEKEKKIFLEKCKIPESEYYKNSPLASYKIGGYSFDRLSGWHHNDNLYDIRLTGPIVKYDDYNRIMPDQYKSLVKILTKKYGKPQREYGLPEWTTLEKGYYKSASIWFIGQKRVEVRISCEGVNYFLNLEVFKPAVKRQIREEKKKKENKATQDALEIL